MTVTNPHQYIAIPLACFSFTLNLLLHEQDTSSEEANNSSAAVQASLAVRRLWPTLLHPTITTLACCAEKSISRNGIPDSGGCADTCTDEVACALEQWSGSIEFAVKHLFGYTTDDTSSREPACFHITSLCDHNRAATAGVLVNLRSKCSRVLSHLLGPNRSCRSRSRFVRPAEMGPWLGVSETSGNLGRGRVRYIVSGEWARACTVDCGDERS